MKLRRHHSQKASERIQPKFQNRKLKEMSSLWLHFHWDWLSTALRRAHGQGPQALTEVFHHHRKLSQWGQDHVQLLQCVILKMVDQQAAETQPINHPSTLTIKYVLSERERQPGIHSQALMFSHWNINNSQNTNLREGPECWKCGTVNRWRSSQHPVTELSHGSLHANKSTHRSNDSFVCSL